MKWIAIVNAQSYASNRLAVTIERAFYNYRTFTVIEPNI